MLFGSFMTILTIINSHYQNQYHTSTATTFTNTMINITPTTILLLLPSLPPSINGKMEEKTGESSKEEERHQGKQDEFRSQLKDIRENGKNSGQDEKVCTIAGKNERRRREVRGKMEAEKKKRKRASVAVSEKKYVSRGRH